MTSSNLVFRRLMLGVVVCQCIGACEYEVPITPSPTRKVQEQLLGELGFAGWQGEHESAAVG